ncbi:hypothetical protein G7046_g3698 [Stylonectria norvegica]|nr:hypothetical protein G7046_g3698 [Stylonectria norvegica]
MSVNPNSVNAGQGEFRDKRPPTAPRTHKGHGAGIHVGNDAVPEFHAETYPPGTAPKDRSFKPGESDSVMPVDASDTLQGITSGDAHRGPGHPGQGQSSREMHGGKRKHPEAGLEGVGANAHDPIHEMGFDSDHPKGQRGDNIENRPSAEELLPTTAEDVAKENK